MAWAPLAVRQSFRQWTVNPERVAFIHGCGENSINQRPPFLDNETWPPAVFPPPRSCKKEALTRQIQMSGPSS